MMIECYYVEAKQNTYRDWERRSTDVATYEEAMADLREHVSHLSKEILELPSYRIVLKVVREVPLGEILDVAETAQATD
jgi:O6-methylguanine-DNA--protein-cysteine methyltransferase